MNNCHTPGGVNNPFSKQWQQWDSNFRQYGCVWR